MEFEVNVCGARAIRASKIVVEILRVFYNELCEVRKSVMTLIK